MALASNPVWDSLRYDPGNIFTNDVGKVHDVNDSVFKRVDLVRRVGRGVRLPHEHLTPIYYVRRSPIRRCRPKEGFTTSGFQSNHSLQICKILCMHKSNRLLLRSRSL